MSHVIEEIHQRNLRANAMGDFREVPPWTIPLHCSVAREIHLLETGDQGKFTFYGSLFLWRTTFPRNFSFWHGVALKRRDGLDLDDPTRRIVIAVLKALLELNERKPPPTPNP